MFLIVKYPRPHCEAAGASLSCLELGLVLNLNSTKLPPFLKETALIQVLVGRDRNILVLLKFRWVNLTWMVIELVLNFILKFLLKWRLTPI